MIYNNKRIGHGLPLTPTSTFLVTARTGGYQVQFIVIAASADDAITRLKANALAVIKEVWSNMTEDDFISRPGGSKFEIITARMTRLLSLDAKLSATELSPDRCYTTSYFDDERSITFP